MKESKVGLRQATRSNKPRNNIQKGVYRTQYDNLMYRNLREFGMSELPPFFKRMLCAINPMRARRRAHTWQIPHRQRSAPEYTGDMTTNVPDTRQQLTDREQTPAEELANAITHGLGLVVSVVCLSVATVLAASRHNPWAIASVSIYGATLCLLYLSSTMYHSLQHPRSKQIWNVLDHSSIYLLIAGTYTPYTLGPLRTAGATMTIKTSR